MTGDNRRGFPLAESFKLCPVCQARNRANASVCAACGASIRPAIVRGRESSENAPWNTYDFRYGETDLLEASVNARGRLFSVLLVLTALVLVTAVLAALLLPRQNARSAIAAVTSAPVASLPPLPTVTPGPPTATFTKTPTETTVPSTTPSPQPCVRRVREGDSMIAILFRCGYNALDIMPTVMALNGIVDETRIQVGQEIVVPWPTPTVNPLATPAPTVDSASLPGEESGGEELALLSFDPFAPTSTATLLPGLMWHSVAAGENMIAIAVQYETNAKTLSDLNPEIEFALCDFGFDFGGPECIVQLSEGQVMRVPAPTPTLTAIPTSSGNETATPLPTATVNQPHALSPANQAYFGRQEQITLRWIATGTLAENEVFRIAVSDIAADVTHTADTRDLFFIVPPQWQAIDDRRHTYFWQVSIVDQATGAARMATEARTLVWEGAGGGG